MSTPSAEGPLVSCIVLVSRTGRYVDECLESVDDQTYPHVEKVVIENRDKHLTIGQGWNQGIRQAKGEYVAVLGDDDILHPDYFKELMAVRNGYDRLVCWCALFDEEGNHIGYLRTEGGEVWKKTSIEKLGGFNEELPRDVDTEITAVAAERGGFTEGILHQFLYGKRLHPKDGDHISVSQSFYDAVKEKWLKGEMNVYAIKGNPPTDTSKYRLHDS